MTGSQSEEERFGQDAQRAMFGQKSYDGMGNETPGSRYGSDLLEISQPPLPPVSSSAWWDHPIIVVPLLTAGVASGGALWEAFSLWTLRLAVLLDLFGGPGRALTDAVAGGEGAAFLGFLLFLCAVAGCVLLMLRSPPRLGVPLVALALFSGASLSAALSILATGRLDRWEFWPAAGLPVAVLALLGIVWRWRRVWPRWQAAEAQRLALPGGLPRQWLPSLGLAALALLSLLLPNAIWSLL